jgi:hypothetical protein
MTTFGEKFIDFYDLHGMIVDVLTDFDQDLCFNFLCDNINMSDLFDLFDSGDFEKIFVAYYMDNQCSIFEQFEEFIDDDSAVDDFTSNIELITNIDLLTVTLSKDKLYELLGEPEDIAAFDDAVNGYLNELNSCLPVKFEMYD